MKMLGFRPERCKKKCFCYLKLRSEESIFNKGRGNWPGRGRESRNLEFDTGEWPIKIGKPTPSFPGKKTTLAYLLFFSKFLVVQPWRC